MIPKRCGSPVGIFWQILELKNPENMEKKMAEVSVSLPPLPPRETKVTLRNKLTVSWPDGKILKPWKLEIVR